jgi:hypothetical protein
MTILLRLTATILALTLVACANQVVKISAGDTVIGQHLSVHLDGAWNQISNVPGEQGVVWTQEGLTIDNLRFWSGIKDGQPIAPPVKDQRPLNFKADMQPHEVVALYQGYYALGGSTFTLDKLEPADFLGTKGFRFQFTIQRKVDDVKLSGVAWAAVVNRDLYAISFTAPRAGFFPRWKDKVEQVARGARLI